MQKVPITGLGQPGAMFVVTWLFWLVCSVAFAAPTKFGDKLNAKFHHDRCLQCHQFNSAKNSGRGFNSHKSRYLCSQCHTPALTGLAAGDWFAPEVKLDHTGMSAKTTCQLIKRSFGGDEKKLFHHLLYDARIRWALDSGMTPGGQKEHVPGGYTEWENDVRAWARDGMLCE